MLEAVDVIMALLAFGPAPTQAALQTLEPIWTRQLEQRIEWVAAVGDSTSPALLVCTSTAALLVIETETGRTRFSTPVQAGPGVRLADGETGDTVYCYDRFSAYALTLRGSPTARHAAGPLLWQAGEWALPPAGYRGDPEFLTRVVAGCATRFGLLVARSDGRVALLARENGHVRWDCRLPRLPDCRLHVCGGTAALVFKEADELKAAFFELDSDHPQPVVRTLGDTWPIWTKLISNQRLVAVWPNRVVVSKPGGPAFSLYPATRDLLRAAVVDVYTPGNVDMRVPAVHQAGRPALLLFGAGGAWLSALDLSTGDWAWTDLLGPQSSLLVSQLRVHDDLVIVSTSRSFRVYRAATGRRVAGRYWTGRAHLLAATVAGEAAYGLYRKPTSAAAAQAEERLVLIRAAFRQTEGHHPNVLDNQQATTRPGAAPTGYRLRSATSPRQILWTRRHLVLVEQKRLRAYTLP